MVAASAFGMMVGSPILIQFSFGALIEPLRAAFGWSKTEATSIISLFIIATVIASPFAGALADRIGARIMVVVSSLAMSALLVAVALTAETLSGFRLLYIGIAFAGAGTSTIVYTRLIANWFVRRRGTALGLGMVGTGLAGAVLPLFAATVVSRYDWKATYMALAALVLVALPIALFVLRERPADLGQFPDGTPNKTEGLEAELTAGLSFKQAVKSRPFLILMSAFFMLGLGMLPIGLLLPAILAGTSALDAFAAAVAAVFGLFMIVGRFAMALLLDRVFAPPIAAAILFIAAIAVPILCGGPPVVVAFVAAAVIGLAAGAEIDFLSFITTRYFGLTAYGRLYGTLFSAFTLGGGIGAALHGRAADATGDFATGAIGAGALMAISSAMLLSLPRYIPTIGRAASP